jgi:glycerol-3-phosphate cytidylyltransferase
MKRIITFGTFDLFHIGHLRILEKSKQEGDYLIVGISSDELNEKKGKKAIFPINERVEIVKALKCVDEVFIEESLEKKDEYIKHFNADLLVMGDDWKDKFDWVSCPVKYLERTPNISTTYLKNSIAMVYKD